MSAELQSVALADLIHEPRWAMVAVPADKWAWFTKLRPSEAIDMWTRDDLINDETCVDAWCELVGANGYDEGYAVVLKCECGAFEAYEATQEMAIDSDDDCIVNQITALDDLMRPFIEAHAPHRWQLRLAI